MEFTFLYPQFLLLLLLVPFFIFVYFFSFLYNKKKALVFANFKAMERFYDIEFFSKNFLALYLNVGILVLLILAIAGTSITFGADTSSFAHMILVDTSESMEADDISPNRLQAAIAAAERFLHLLPLGTEVGLISFSGDAKVLHSIDTSKVKVQSSLQEVMLGEIPGTNIYNALVTANKIFGDLQLKSILLISDGQSNVQDAPQIINYIEQNRLVVHVLAVGTKEGGITNQNVLSKLDEDFLKAISFNSGGGYFLAEDEETLKNAIDEIVQLTNREVSLDLTFYFLLAALLLFTLHWVLHNLRFRVVP